MTPLLTGVFASQISGHLTVPDSGAMFPIAMVNVGSAGASTITFSSIPDTYKHLQLRFVYETGDWGTFRFNGDTTASNYSGHVLFGGGSSVSASYSSNVIYEPQGSNGGGRNTYAGIIDILDYTSTNKTKVTRSIEGCDYDSGGQFYFTSGLWNSTSKITSISMTRNSNDWAQNSKFVLYGIKG